jgi:dienelactone hydrolase
MPEWLKPGLYGAAVGAVAISIVGFSWGGWMTSGAASEASTSMAMEQTTAALVPTCLAMSQADPDRVAKLAVIQSANTYSRGKAVMEAGWAMAPGMDAPDSNLAKACVTALELDDS